jgi:hypothetical protein
LDVFRLMGSAASQSTAVAVRIVDNRNSAPDWV